MIGSSVLPKAREMAVRHAISQGYTHLLFLDDDMAFGMDLLDNLLVADKDIIGVNYSNKNPGGPKPMTHGLDGAPVSSIDVIGVQEVGWIGFGAVLIRLDAVKDIPSPLFEMRWLAERNDFIGEDFFFCGLVRGHGLKIFVHHDVPAAHIGDYPYREV